MRYDDARMEVLGFDGSRDSYDCVVVKVKGKITIDFDSDQIFKGVSIDGTHYRCTDASGNKLELHRFHRDHVYVGVLREDGYEYLVRLTV